MKLFFQALTRRDAYDKHPKTGAYLKYANYREAIAEDCQFHCVYCDSHEDSIGGREATELDHFRPWRKTFGAEKIKKFEHLKDDPTNLVHACRPCNGFKWSHWPTEDPDKAYDHEKGWIEPFKEARTDFFNVQADGEINPKKTPAKYQIEQLRLNRPLLKRRRELRLILIDWKESKRSKWLEVANKKPETEESKAIFEAVKLLEIMVDSKG